MEKKIIFMSHCIINQHARAKGVKNKLAGKAIVEPILDLIKSYNVGIIQLPCPEIKYEGLIRNACGKDKYNNSSFISICKDYAQDVRFLVNQYGNAGYFIVGFIGVDYSPTCGITFTSLGNGQKSKEPGLLFKEIMDICKMDKTIFNFLGVSLNNNAKLNETKERLEEMLRQS
jgi:predicted secreted protein